MDIIVKLIIVLENQLDLLCIVNGFWFPWVVYGEQNVDNLIELPLGWLPKMHIHHSLFNQVRVKLYFYDPVYIMSI